MRFFDFLLKLGNSLKKFTSKYIAIFFFAIIAENFFTVMFSKKLYYLRGNIGANMPIVLFKRVSEKIISDFIAGEIKQLVINEFILTS